MHILSFGEYEPGNILELYMYAGKPQEQECATSEKVFKIGFSVLIQDFSFLDRKMNVEIVFLNAFQGKYKTPTGIIQKYDIQNLLGVYLFPFSP